MFNQLVSYSCTVSVTAIQITFYDTPCTAYRQDYTDLHTTQGLYCASLCSLCSLLRRSLLHVYGLLHGLLSTDSGRPCLRPRLSSFIIFMIIFMMACHFLLCWCWAVLHLLILLARAPVPLCLLVDACTRLCKGQEQGQA